MIRTRLAPFLSLCLILAACGGSEESSDGRSPTNNTSSPVSTNGEQPDPSEDETDVDENGAAEALPDGIVFALPADIDVPPGYQLIANACEGDEWGAALGYAYPEEWEVVGWGMGGSGGIVHASVDHRFETPSGTVDFQIRWQEEDQFAGSPFGPDDDEDDHPFGREVHIGDRTITVTPTEHMTLSIGDQAVTLWISTEKEYPEVVDGTLLQADAEIATVTASGGEIRIEDRAIIHFSIADDAADDDTIRTILESLHLPECARHAAIVNYELILSTDLDGDGEISTVEDLLALND